MQTPPINPAQEIPTAKTENALAETNQKLDSLNAQLANKSKEEPAPAPKPEPTNYELMKSFIDEHYPELGQVSERLASTFVVTLESELATLKTHAAQVDEKNAVTKRLNPN